MSQQIPPGDAPPSYSEAVEGGPAPSQFSHPPGGGMPYTQASSKVGPYPPAGLYPPAGSYPPTGVPAQAGGSSAHTVVIQQQPVSVPGQLRFGSRQAVVVCPLCHAQVTTTLEYKTGSLTWVLCLVLTVSMLFCGCCLIPFCMDQTKDVNHRCPNCKEVIGRFSRL